VFKDLRTSYGPPVVYTISLSRDVSAVVDGSPASTVVHVPTTGNAVLYVSGFNLGFASPSSLRLLWNGIPIDTVIVTNPHTRFQFRSLPGDDVISLSLSVSGQLCSSAALLAAVAFAPPSVRVLHVAVDPSSELPIQCSSAGPDGIGNNQSTLVLINGTDFGLGTRTSVVIRDAPCAVVFLSPTYIVCRTTYCSGMCVFV
jgi:hypothetical protein